MVLLRRQSRELVEKGSSEFLAFEKGFSLEPVLIVKLFFYSGSSREKPEEPLRVPDVTCTCCSLHCLING